MKKTSTNEWTHAIIYMVLFSLMFELLFIPKDNIALFIVAVADPML